DRADPGPPDAAPPRRPGLRAARGPGRSPHPLRHAPDAEPEGRGPLGARLGDSHPPARPPREHAGRSRQEGPAVVAEPAREGRAMKNVPVSVAVEEEELSPLQPTTD